MDKLNLKKIILIAKLNALNITDKSVYTKIVNARDKRTLKGVFDKYVRKNPLSIERKLKYLIKNKEFIRSRLTDQKSMLFHVIDTYVKFTFKNNKRNKKFQDLIRFADNLLKNVNNITVNTDLRSSMKKRYYRNKLTDKVNYNTYSKDVHNLKLDKLQQLFNDKQQVKTFIDLVDYRNFIIYNSNINKKPKSVRRSRLLAYRMHKSFTLNTFQWDLLPKIDSILSKFLVDNPKMDQLYEKLEITNGIINNKDLYEYIRLISQEYIESMNLLEYGINSVNSYPNKLSYTEFLNRKNKVKQQLEEHKNLNAFKQYIEQPIISEIIENIPSIKSFTGMVITLLEDNDNYTYDSKLNHEWFTVEYKFPYNNMNVKTTEFNAYINRINAVAVPSHERGLIGNNKRKMYRNQIFYPYWNQLDFNYQFIHRKHNIREENIFYDKDTNVNLSKHLRSLIHLIQHDPDFSYKEVDLNAFMKNPNFHDKVNLWHLTIEILKYVFDQCNTNYTLKKFIDYVKEIYDKLDKQIILYSFFGLNEFKRYIKELTNEYEVKFPNKRILKAREFKKAITDLKNNIKERELYLTTLKQQHLSIRRFYNALWCGSLKRIEYNDFNTFLSIFTNDLFAYFDKTLFRHIQTIRTKLELVKLGINNLKEQRINKLIKYQEIIKETLIFDNKFDEVLSDRKFNEYIKKLELNLKFNIKLFFEIILKLSKYVNLDKVLSWIGIIVFNNINFEEKLLNL